MIDSSNSNSNTTASLAFLPKKDLSLSVLNLFGFEDKKAHGQCGQCFVVVKATYVTLSQPVYLCMDK